jgi:hypothetical protein
MCGCSGGPSLIHTDATISGIAPKSERQAVVQPVVSRISQSHDDMSNASVPQLSLVWILVVVVVASILVGLAVFMYRARKTNQRQGITAQGLTPSLRRVVGNVAVDAEEDVTHVGV